MNKLWKYCMWYKKWIASFSYCKDKKRMGGITPNKQETIIFIEVQAEKAISGVW